MALPFPIKIGLPGSNRALYHGMRNGIIRDVIGGSWWWRQRVRLRDFTPAAATNQTLVFATLFPNNPFPLRVIRKSVLVHVEESIVGPSISAGTIIVGDTLDPNGLLEATSGDILLNDDAILQDLAAVEIAAGETYEADFVTDGLCFRIDTTGANISVATALDLTFMVEFTPSLYVP